MLGTYNPPPYHVRNHLMITKKKKNKDVEFTLFQITVSTA